MTQQVGEDRQQVYDDRCVGLVDYFLVSFVCLLSGQGYRVQFTSQLVS